MGVTAAVAAISVAGVATYASVDNANHAKTDANNAANVANDTANSEIATANAKQQAGQNATANNTQAAQARVRAISNPDGNTIMTSPLGAIGPQTASPDTPNLSGPGPSPGPTTIAGKQVLGG